MFKNLWKIFEKEKKEEPVEEEESSTQSEEEAESVDDPVVVEEPEPLPENLAEAEPPDEPEIAIPLPPTPEPTEDTKLVTSGGRNKLHIGYNRTGTTFLQKLVFPHLENYKGRLYLEDGDEICNLSSHKIDRQPKQTCQNILNHFKGQKDLIVSAEWFSLLPHEDLFELLGDDEWDVLVVTRDVEDLVASWKRKGPSRNFFLRREVKRRQMQQVVRDFYNPDNLKVGIKNLTILSYEKLFSGDLDEIQRLSDFLGADINKIFLDNLGTVVNGSK